MSNRGTPCVAEGRHHVDERRGRLWLPVLGRVLAGAVALWVILVGLGKLVVTYWSPSRFGQADADVVEYLEAQRTPAGKTISLVAVLLADTVTVVGLTTVAVLGLYLLLRRWAEPLFVAACVVGETSIFTATTALVDRQRPPVVHLDVSPPTSGFPSGHTAAAVCLYGALALIGGVLVKRRAYRRLFWAGAVIVPLAVAAGRLYRGMHFPSDVVAGALLGVMWLTWMTRIYPLGKGAARAAEARA